MSIIDEVFYALLEESFLLYFGYTKFAFVRQIFNLKKLGILKLAIFRFRNLNKNRMVTQKRSFLYAPYKIMISSIHIPDLHSFKKYSIFKKIVNKTSKFSIFEPRFLGSYNSIIVFLYTFHRRRLISNFGSIN